MNSGYKYFILDDSARPNSSGLGSSLMRWEPNSEISVNENVEYSPLPRESFRVVLSISPVQVALLHDTIEDTATDFHELENKFGIDIAEAVSALSKNDTLPKDRRMQDSLDRIKALPTEVWSVKLADRITNLQPPPSHWDNEKKIKYHHEAQKILDTLASGNAYLSTRLASRIKEYETFIIS